MDDENKMKDEKFILMGLDDSRAGSVAEVLKNKTCKKILDFLSDIREASEKDISDKLDMPINTVEYNLKKLMKSGLVGKAKNFFWSVKGKKIPMYKLAKKHIIISPNKAPSLSYLKSILPVIFIAAILAFALAAIFLFPEDEPIIIDETTLKQFSSQAELNDFIKENMEASSSGFFGRFGGVMKGGMEVTMAEGAVTGATQDTSSDYSTTNIQVEGVDEADIVKNDGKYIYVVSGSKVVIVNAYPAENMEILSEIEFDGGVSEIFINDDKLIVFSYNSVYIYDVLDKEDPELENEIESDGNYVDSRMIGDYVYVISTKHINTRNPEPPVYRVNEIKEKVAATDVYYIPSPGSYYVFTNIMAIDIDDGDVETEVYLTDSSRTLYVSQDNIYLTHTKRFDYTNYAEEIAEEVYFPLLPEEYDEKIEDVLDSDDEYWGKINEIEKITKEYYNDLPANELSEFAEELSERLEDFEIKIQKQMEKTIVHKINIDEMNIEYKGKGEVPGSILNQFSMDEYDGYFRIATTTSRVRTGGGSLNHLYILDEDLDIIGSVEDLAEGERIYSVRFLGERAYIVTFKKIDPLFVIDVSNPEEPEVLGYLKITGYSDYLHIYDENHVIGIGKETAGGNEDFSWYQGVKVSLFDVSDVENPVEKAKIEIGDRGTGSDALRDHRAVLFDKEKNLLVIPINLAEIDETKYADGDIPDNAYGEYVWQGAFVLDISLDGISERGRITHDDTGEEKGGHYWGGKYNVQRSLYMDDVLYTISNSMIKANDLESIDEINNIELGYENKYDYPIYEASI